MAQRKKKILSFCCLRGLKTSQKSFEGVRHSRFTAIYRTLKVWRSFQVMPRESNDISSPINLKALQLISGPRDLANTFSIDSHSKLFSYVYYRKERLSLESRWALVVNEQGLYFFSFEVNWGLWEPRSVSFWLCQHSQNLADQLSRIKNIVTVIYSMTNMTQIDKIH